MEEQEIKEKLKKDILQLLSYCINCRFCLPSCPLFDITSGDVSQGASGITRALYYTIKWGETDKEILGELRDLIYSCMTCKNCEIACKNLSTATKLLEAIEKGRQLLIDEMIGPMPEQKRALESLEKHGNPYGMLPTERRQWMKELNAPVFSREDGSEILLYIGCTAPQDAIVQNMAKALVKLLKMAQVQFGIMEDEICCGSPALIMGETLLFEELCNKNLGQLESLGVRHIVTLSPHCFDTFSKRYPEKAMDGIKIQHYSQLLTDLIYQKRLIFKSKYAQKVTYQDPCYLGRHNDVYEAPRKVIRSIPGIELIEFPKSRVDSICCGGGGGRMWADFKAEVDRIANIRVKEALEIDVQAIVTACPWCLINMIDSVKSVEAEARLRVLDLAELCTEALQIFE